MSNPAPTPNPTPPAAFELVKGPRQLLSLSEAEVERLLDPGALLDGLAQGFAALERGTLQSPPRSGITLPGKGFSLAMPAWQPGQLIAVKVVNVFDGNPALGLPSHLAMVMLFDPDTGATRCVMDGTCITGLRTAASAVLSARLLARHGARIATVVGAGVQAREHLRLLPLVRDFRRIHVWALDPAEAERLARREPLARACADLQAAVRESDLVCLATHSPAPVIDAGWVRPGTHVTSVGYHPPAGELPRALAQQGRLFVETLDAFAPLPVGCAELAGLDPGQATTLGAVVTGRARGRTHNDEVTVYKAMGTAMEDMVAANLAYRAALVQGVGSQLTW